MRSLPVLLVHKQGLKMYTQQSRLYERVSGTFLASSSSPTLTLEFVHFFISFNGSTRTVLKRLIYGRRPHHTAQIPFLRYTYNKFTELVWNAFYV